MPDEAYQNEAGMAAGISSAINNLSSYMAAQGTSRRQRKWNEEMYSLQRSHAKQDWDTQNTYNSPVEQIKRLEAAGLNKSLIYGGSGGGSAGAAQPINETSVMGYSPKVPTDGITSPVAAAQNAQLLQKQLANMDAQNALLRTQSLQALANTNSLNSGTENKNLDTAITRELHSMGLFTNTKQAQYDKLIADISMTNNEDIRRDVMQGHNIKQMTERLLSSQQVREQLRPEQIRLVQEQIKLMEQQGRLRHYDELLNKAGTHRGDAWSILMRLLKSVMGPGSPGWMED